MHHRCTVSREIRFNIVYVTIHTDVITGVLGTHSTDKALRQSRFTVLSASRRGFGHARRPAHVEADNVIMLSCLNLICCS